MLAISRQIVTISSEIRARDKEIEQPYSEMSFIKYNSEINNRNMNNQSGISNKLTSI